MWFSHFSNTQACRLVPFWQALLWLKNRSQNIILHHWFLLASLFLLHEKEHRSFGRSCLIWYGSHVYCCLPRSSITSPKAAIILIYKYVTLLFVLFTHKWTHTVRLGTDSYLCPTRHVNTDMQMQFFCTFLWYVNSRNPESLHTWLLKAQQKNSFDSVLNPLKEQRGVMCESSKSTACYTFIFTCNHFLPSTTQNPPLPSSSL